MRPIERQTILVTGATSGLGRALAERLAGLGATVIVHGRDSHRTTEVCTQITEAHTGADCSAVVADLASLAEVDRMAREVTDRHPEVHTLVSNAGLGFGGTGEGRAESADGIELRFAVNYLAGAELIRRLAPTLIESAPARIVQVASAAQAPLNFDDPLLERRYGGQQAYAQSKLAQVMLTFDLAERFDPSQVTANALHPATFMDTKMVVDAGVRPTSSVSEGLEAVLRLVTDADLDGVSGRFFQGTDEVRAHPSAYDRDARAQLRELTESLLERVATA